MLLPRLYPLWEGEHPTPLGTAASNRDPASIRGFTDIGQIFASGSGVPHFNAFARDDSL